MAFNKVELAHIDATVGDLIRRRQPPQHLWDQLRFELEIEGHKVRILEVRPRWNDPTQHVRSGVAQFTRTRDAWELYWMRRDGKWHAWDPDENTGTLAELVGVVDEDARGGFWG